jgi:hypothetical protein
MAMSGWKALRDEFERRASTGPKTRLWLRDDDATEATPALDRLRRIASGSHVPVVLAVIPRAVRPEFGRWLADWPRARGAVHGFAHANHAPVGEKRQEFGAHRPLEEMERELRQGLERVCELLGERALPMLVPPWNRMDETILPRLPALGYRAFSSFGPEERLPRVPGVSVMNAHLDLVDWRGTRRCLPHEELLERLIALLRDRTDGDKGPIGVLTHHLVHDEAAWSFLERLIEAADGVARWVEPD